MADTRLEGLPEPEKALANTVDPWGLPFSDQLARFEGIFAESPDAYWFRGQTVPAGETMRAERLWAVAGETQSFQIAVLPAIGAPEETYVVNTQAEGRGVLAEVFREVYVRTAPVMYPRYNVELWPDPLVPESEETIGGTDLAAFWIDVRIPADFAGERVLCTVTVSGADQEATWEVPIQVVSGLELQPNEWPLIAWFWPRYPGGSLDDARMRDMYALLLEHHFQPVNALKGRWDPANPQAFDDLHEFLVKHGQTLFELDRPDSDAFESLYQHVKAGGWLDRCVAYSNQDEPSDEEFVAKNIPFMRMVREKYPGIKVYVASDWHEDMYKGCDIWMTDISASGYDPDEHRDLAEPELWHYYCHLPIKWQMRAPLVRAPNMQIDNDALEQRLALWMSHYYGARTVFLWAGNSYTFGDDFWNTLTLSDKPSGFPYAGVHNGNGWVVYPPREEGGAVLPSLRLKVLRAGIGGAGSAGKRTCEGCEGQRVALSARPPARVVHPSSALRPPA